jgi:hypothetical protein
MICDDKLLTALNIVADKVIIANLTMVTSVKMVSVVPIYIDAFYW